MQHPIHPDDERLAALPPGHQEQSAEFVADGTPHEFRLLAFVGGKKLRAELGEVCVCVARGDDAPHLLSPALEVELSDESWGNYVATVERAVRLRDDETRRRAAPGAARRLRISRSGRSAPSPMSLRGAATTMCLAMVPTLPSERVTAQTAPVLLCGRGAEAYAEALGCAALPEDPGRAVEQVALFVGAGSSAWGDDASSAPP